VVGFHTKCERASREEPGHDTATGKACFAATSFVPDPLLSDSERKLVGAKQQLSRVTAAGEPMSPFTSIPQSKLH
jgi:hypothetical protein